MRQEPFAPRRTSVGGEGWSLVLSVAEALQAGGSLERRLSEIADLVTRSLGLDAAAILLVDPDTNRLVVKGSRGLSTEYVHLLNDERTIGLDEGPEGQAPTTRAFKLGRIVVIGDIREDDTFAPWREAAVAQGFVSFLAVPLVLGDRILGCLNGYSRTPHRFGEAEVGLFAVLAQFLAVATELAELYEALRMHLDLLDRAERIHEALTSAVFQEDSLEALAATLGHLLDAEVLITDAKGVPAARSLGVPEAVVRLVGEELRHRHRERRHSATPFPIPSGPLGPFLLAQAALSGERLFGYVVLVKDDTHVDALHLQSLAQAATVAALAFSRRLAQTEALSRQKAEFLLQLLSHEEVGSTLLRRRAEALGLRPGAPHRVLLLELPFEEARLGVELEALEAVFRSAGRGALALREEGHLVVVAEEGVPIDEALRESLLAALGAPRSSPARLVAGPAVPELRKAGRSYREALDFLILARRLEVPRRTLVAEEFGVWRFLFDTRHPEELRRFAESLLERLGSHAALPLLATLEAYLTADGDVAAAAKALHVHPNTIRYRLARLSEVSGRRLDHLPDLLELAFALLVVRLLGLEEEEGKGESTRGPSRKERRSRSPKL